MNYQQQIFKNAAMMLHWSLLARNMVINRLQSNIEMDNIIFLNLFTRQKYLFFKKRKMRAKSYEVIASMLVLLLAI